MSVQITSESAERTEYVVDYTHASRCQSMWQWRNHGPGLFVLNRNVSCIANTDDVTPNRVGVVVCRAASHTDNIEVMSVQMEGVLGKEALRQMNMLASRKLTFNPPGMETSTVEFFGRV